MCTRAMNNDRKDIHRSEVQALTHTESSGWQIRGRVHPECALHAVQHSRLDEIEGAVSVLLVRLEDQLDGASERGTGLCKNLRRTPSRLVM